MTKSLSDDTIGKLLGQQETHDRMLIAHKPFFGPELRKQIGQAIKNGMDRVTLDGRLFTIRFNPEYPQYVFVNSTRISGASACLNKDDLLRSANEVG